MGILSLDSIRNKCELRTHSDRLPQTLARAPPLPLPSSWEWSRGVFQAKCIAGAEGCLVDVGVRLELEPAVVSRGNGHPHKRVIVIVHHLRGQDACNCVCMLAGVGSLVCRPKHKF